ncbi:hypothetical protein B0T26DRAFT_650784 [Lasiosphaeria miniovina]|uniref:Uncharacterized protein n=1 Tax=Lasiosphaeria miniovina TaxID=1954250 RepID=A0AA40DQT8_9PEZI|nr:uncharacterized protein B0T26DRAFT_650784 [Lasiosphaeria miniovina]KAK0712729.1 hypothetical protein B0T26DRAFT_650784 [Lasiosphaeria miniovina]
MPPIPGSPIDGPDGITDNISPILSRGPPPTTSADNNLASPSSPSDDVIPEEHKRVPGLIPRSPLSPLRGFMSRRGRKPAPHPIVTQPYLASQGGKAAVTPGMVSVGIQSPAAALAQAKPKRRTAWGIIDGWWDLGLLERMNTVKRRK